MFPHVSVGSLQVIAPRPRPRLSATIRSRTSISPSVMVHPSGSKAPFTGIVMPES
jgi:hypothetical protein